MYVKHCKLTNYQQLRLLEYFVAGTPARTAADLVCVHRNSAIRFFHKLRGEIAIKQQNRAAQFCGEIEVDESYFGGRRKGKRGRGAAGKVIVFGLLKRGGKVYTVSVSNVQRKTLLPLIRRKIRPDSIVYTDGHTAYNALDVSEFTHFRINHSREFVHNRNHINGIENFWSQAKRHLRKYNGIPKQNFELFLKECEWRFNEGSPKQLLD
ncbi:MAG: IS1595 family transposase, partial [Alphaproteobacteria bacterium]|nr:IS1595 family transposase [Alphaproteobacteria bacterium]